MNQIFVLEALALELDGRVVDLEAAAQQLAGVVEDGVVAAAARPFASHHDVAAQRHQPAVQPAVQPVRQVIQPAVQQDIRPAVEPAKRVVSNKTNWLVVGIVIAFSLLVLLIIAGLIGFVVYTKYS